MNSEEAGWNAQIAYPAPGLSAYDRLTRSQSSPAVRRVLWCSLLVLLLIAELVVLTLPFDPRGSVAEEGFWAGALFYAQEGIRPAFITAVMAAVFLSRRVLREELQRIFAETNRPIISARWIAVHLVLLSVLVLGTRTVPIHLTSVAVWGGWLF